MRNTVVGAVAIALLLMAFLAIIINNQDGLYLKNHVRRLTNQQNMAVIDPDYNHEYQHYRFLTFGTSKTWGSGLENRSVAYPYLLSPSAKNLAIRAAGPEIPSLCTQSMVGDEVYDVIVLEFFYHSNNYLVRLVHRLRKRFPKATFIFLVIWSPFQFMYIGDGPDKGKSLKTMLELRGATPENYQYLLTQIVNEHENKDWKYIYHPNAKKHLNRAVKEVGGIVISQELNQDEVKPYLLKFGQLFIYDTVHFSEAGHRWMRSAILNMLRSYKVPQSNEINEWDGEDICNTFYTDGNLRGLEHDPNLVLNEFKPDKFALEMRNVKKTWIKISNKMNRPAELFMNYMAMGPISTTYPTVHVTVSGALDNPGGVEIHPYDRMRAYMVHIVEQRLLGVIPPGDSIITIEEVKPNKDPFRIVGLILTPQVQIEVDESTLKQPDFDTYVTAVQ